MWEYTYTDTLYHHGIKGMKWGVRKYQSKDGSLTPAGKKRYLKGSSSNTKDNTQSSNKKSSRYDKLYDDYKTLGYSDERAKQAAEGRVRSERALKIIGGVAVTAVAAYAAYHYYDTHADRKIKPGQIMQTVHKGDAAERLKSGNPFYSTYTKADNTIYSSKVFSHFGKDSNVTRFYTNDGIKVASEATSRKVLNELVKTNPEVAEYMKRISTIRGKKKGYHQFNYSLVLRTGQDNDVAKRLGLADLDHDKIHNIFYNKLKEKGYGGLIDTNDAKSEGFTWSPVIVFDDSKKHIVSSSKATAEQLGTKQLAKGSVYSLARHFVNKPINVNDPNVIMGGAYLAALGIGRAVDNKRTDSQVKFVRKYLDEHPNTTLTNEEIAKMYGKRQK